MVDLFKCIICKDIVFNPVQTKCGCRMCESCCDAFLKLHLQDVQCPGNTEICDLISSSEANKPRPDHAARRELANLEVHCVYFDLDLNDGCTYVSKWSNLNEHLKNSCEFKLVDCENCSKKIKSKEFKDHLEHFCEYALSTCSFCKLEFSKQELSEHLDLSKDNCCKFITNGECKFCKTEGLSSISIVDHKKTCKKWVSQCLFHGIGCNKVENDALLQEHYIDACSLHAEHLLNDNNRLHDELSKLKYHSEKIKEDLHAKLEKFEKNLIYSTKLLTQNQIILAQCLEDKSALDLRLNSSQVGHAKQFVSYDGKLVWKITGYAKKRHDALNSTTTSLFSDEFYTNMFEYKMCARIYLNGDGVGKGTHISLFFILMKHDYDDSLQWPFSKKVTFMLLDQDQGTNHYKDSFFPDLNSNSFQKPRTERNIATGCPKFISIQSLENSKYLKNDTLMVKVIIE